MMATLLALLYLVLALLTWHELLGKQLPHSAHAGWAKYAHPAAYAAIAAVTYFVAVHH